MMQTVDAVLKHWRPVLERSYDRKLVNLMLDRARVVIERAKAAEDEGRIGDMQPLFAVPNLDNPQVAQGYFFLEIRYRPVSEGWRGDTQSYRAAILRPEDHPKQQYSLVDLMFAG